MRFFFDNNFSPRYVRALRAMDEDVVHLRGALGEGGFPANTPDEEWIPQVGTRGWRLVTFDLRIKRNPGQRLILEAAGVVSFMCADGTANLSDWDKFVWLVRAWPEIRVAGESTHQAVTYRVTMQRKVERWK